MVLLHGQPGRGRDWDRVVAALDGLRVLAPDRPGYDGTPARDFVGNARALATLLHDAGVPRVVLVGHSWGGGVALQFALDHPDRVAALCLVGSVGSPLAITAADRVLSLPGVRKAAGLAACAATLSPRSVTTVAGLRWLREGAVSSCAAEQSSLLRDSPGLTARLDEVRAPTLVLSGRGDRSVPLAAAADLADRMPRSRLQAVPGGHGLPRHAPEVVAAAIQESVRTALW